MKSETNTESLPTVVKKSTTSALETQLEQEVCSPDCTAFTWPELKSELDKLHPALQWMKWRIGNLLSTAAINHPTVTKELLATGKWSDSDVAKWAIVAKRVPPERRKPQLEFHFHQEVAQLEPAEQNEWLEHAKNRRETEMLYTNVDLRQEIREQLVLPELENTPIRPPLKGLRDSVLFLQSKVDFYMSHPDARLKIVEELKPLFEIYQRLATA